MGRLAHLRQTLPLVVAEFEQAILVDFSCPEHSGRWAKQRFGAAIDVVEVPGQSRFHKTRALNAGARRAAELGSAWLLFLDSDTLVAPGLLAACAQRAVAGQFVLGDRHGWSRLESLTGVLLVARADFEGLGGYDESFANYGFEDVEMRCRLRLRGNLAVADLPTGLCRGMPHGDELRTKFYASKNRSASEKKNFAKLRALVRRWTGRDISAVPEIQDILYQSTPKDANAARRIALLNTAVQQTRAAVACRSRWSGGRKLR
jgi:GT2 family glycosyltransferase